MTLSLSILLTTVILAIYWFRYACSLMLQLAEDDRRAAAALAEKNWLRFPAYAEDANRCGRYETVGLCRALDRDYRHLMYLAGSDGMEISLSERCLMAADYHLMSMWFRLSRCLRLPFATCAFCEMVGVLLYLSHAVGRRLKVEPCPRGNTQSLCTSARPAM
jgi:hypothetical protein